MRGPGDRWAWLRRRRASNLASGSEVDRRTLLMGAAATAGVVAVGASPAIAAPAAAATPSLTDATFAAGLATTALVAASDVSVVPAGELIDTDVQAALEALDRRLSKVHLIDDLQVAATLVDDFMGNTAASGTIGQLGWALPVAATGTATVGVSVGQPGIFTIGTGTSASGWQDLNLGDNNLQGGRVMLCEWRCRIYALDTTSDKCSWWLGLHNNLAGAEPTTGFYFRYTAGDGANWHAVCANAGSRMAVNTNTAADTNYHRFRITCDGNGIARFYIDSALVATITTSLPTTNRYSPNLSIRKTAGTTARFVSVDYFALRYEHAR